MMLEMIGVRARGLAHQPFRRSNLIMSGKDVFIMSFIKLVFFHILQITKSYNPCKNRKKKSTINAFFTSFYNNQSTKNQDDNSHSLSCKIPDLQNSLLHALTDLNLFTSILPLNVLFLRNA